MTERSWSLEARFGDEFPELSMRRFPVRYRVFAAVFRRDQVPPTDRAW